MKKVLVMLMVAALATVSQADIVSLNAELNFEYMGDGTAPATGAVAAGGWSASNVYDDVQGAGAWNVPGYVANYTTYDTTGLPAGMDGYAIDGGALYNGPGGLTNDGSGFTSMARVNLLGVTDDWTVVMGRPWQYLVFMNPSGDLNLWIDGVGDAVAPATDGGIVSAANLGTFTDTWVDIAFTFDGVGNDGLDDTYSLYVNGQLLYTNTADTLVTTGDVEHFGSREGGGQKFTGMMDYYAYYSGAATAQEIASMAVITDTIVPEPATMALLGFGALAMLRKRK